MSKGQNQLSIRNGDNSKYVDISTYQRTPMRPTQGCISKSNKYKIIINEKGSEFYLVPHKGKFLKMETIESATKRGVVIDDVSYGQRIQASVFPIRNQRKVA